MSASVDCKLERIAEMANKYDSEYNPKGSLLDTIADAKKATKVMFKYFFQRARNEKVAQHYLEALNGALDSHWNDLMRALSPPRVTVAFDDYQSVVRKLLSDYEGKCKGSANNMDKNLILSYFLDACPALVDYGYNPVLYAKQKIEGGKTWEAYYFFLGVKGVGGKLAAFFLREIVDAYDLRGKLNPGDLPYVFPVDTWVKRVVKNLWEELVSQRSDKPTESEEKEIWTVVYVGITGCNRNGIHPIDFNKGAWYLGSRSKKPEKLKGELDRACP